MKIIVTRCMIMFSLLWLSSHSHHDHRTETEGTASASLLQSSAAIQDRLIYKQWAENTAAMC